MNELTTIERSELEQHEAIISRGLKTFVDVGAALLAIRDGRLYRAEFGTFEDYCRERWQISNEYARLHMRAAEVVNNLQKTPTIVGVLPATESQARPLTRLDPIEQPVIWQRAVETAPNGKVTAAHVETTVKEFVREKTTFVTPAPSKPVYWTPEPAPITEQPLPAWAADFDQNAEAVIEDEEIAAIVTPQVEPALEPEQPANSMAIHFSSETAEHYTPSRIIDLVLEVMAGIDLDPCSNSKAKPNVPAAVHYTKEDNGLDQSWCGSVYMNPPYGREIGEWVEKLCCEFEQGNVTEAIALVPARVDTAWWNRLTSANRTYPLACFVKGRLVFVNNDDPAPFPSALVYLGDNRIEFYEVFSRIGRIWGAWDDEIAGMVDYGK